LGQPHDSSGSAFSRPAEELGDFPEMTHRFHRGQEVRYVGPRGATDDPQARTIREAIRIWAQSEEDAESGEWLFFCQLPDGRPRHGIRGNIKDFKAL